MNISQPIASYIGGVGFGPLTKDDIKHLSVKQITHASTFDDLLHPEPAGLYDPALGASGDELCRTCNLKAWTCPGHPGHIELPVMVYNPFFMPQLMHLLNAKCAYCHHLRTTAPKVELAKCKLKLLEKGLIEEAEAIDNITLRSEQAKASGEGDSSAGDADDHAQELTEKQRQYVKVSLRKAHKEKSQQGVDLSKSEAVSARRRAVIAQLLAESRHGRICPSCKGLNHKLRKDGFNKIFSKPLSALDRKRMHYKGRKIQNALVVAAKQRKRDVELSRQDREIDEAIGYDSDELNSPSDDGEDIEMTEDESDNASPLARDKGKTSKPPRTSDKYNDRYVSPQEAYATLGLLFKQENELFQLIYNRGAASSRKPLDPDMFFIEHLLVPPNRFRPEMKNTDGSTVEATDNSLYKAVLNSSSDFVKAKSRADGVESQPAERAAAYADLQRRHILLQDAVNAISDSQKGPRQSNPLRQRDGIKQKLEKKEGLFRMNMMGKRVNFAARSVISPDPNIETNEIGVPPVFAKKLTFAEPVTNHNYAELKEAVLNGVSKWPGAAAIENESGQVINLRFKTSDERLALANLLLQPSNPVVNGSRSKKVHRHLVNGDIVLMNRQPTLHKPSIMAHKTRILPGEKTIRMHYANCNTYNADFDGDEMNMHFPQNELARAEALQIADTDHQYLVATSGKPLRGLIQDHISMGVWLTSRDTFFTREDYHQLLCSCLRPEKDDTHSHKIETVEPSIVWPRKLWTGKQIITTVLKNIQPGAHEPLQLQGKSQTLGDPWGDAAEGEVIVKDGELLCGILDKAHLGPSTGGLVHAIYEIYGHSVAGQLLSILGRLLTRFLHMRAFTCGIDDLRLTPDGEAKRLAKIARSVNLGQQIAAKYVTMDENTPEDDPEMQNRLQEVYRDEKKHTGIDNVYNTRNAELSSEITVECLPKCLVKPFPRNQMQTMTVSGAKGSSVNANFISCNLGQQVLEGRRVPIMVSGRTLPSFKPFDTSIRSGGYITNRFLTGIRPQEYFFHAMAGREGLIDTAVKTARSGYLQRCLIKGMEGLRSEYDASVRDSDGSIIQFMYGEDGLDVTKQKHLTDFHFQLENYLSLTENLNLREIVTRIQDRGALEHNKAALKKYMRTGRLDCMDPALALYNPSSNAGSTSEAFALALKQYSDKNPDKLLVDKRNSMVTNPILKKSTFASLMNAKYLKSTIEPGEAIGVVAGQSIGEPSTQMTLNTFHLAGHAAKNVTLGIPRLREIVMTATRNISTPTMTLHPIEELTNEAGEKFAKGITRLTMAEVTDNVQVSERIGQGIGYDVAKIYTVRVNLFPAIEYCETYAITVSDVLRTLESGFVPLLCKDIKKELKRKNNARLLGDHSAQPEVGKSSGRTEELAGDQNAEKEGGEDDEEDDDGDATNAKEKKNRGEATTYDDPDDDEAEALARESERRGSPDAESDIDSALGGSPKSPSRKTGVSEDEDQDNEEEEESKTIKSAARELENRVKEKSTAVTRFVFDTKKAEVCEFQLEYDISTPKLLLLPLVESACRKAIIQSIPKLGACTFTKDKVKNPSTGQLEDVPVVLTQGVNLPAMHAFQDILNPHRIFTNDIWAVQEIYGVEAGRANIVREMDAVFKGHSITVDTRHLNLIADYMTRSGSIQSFSRTGIVDSVSPLQKASFETTTKFVRDAVLDRDWDDLQNPSARIVVGRLSGVGTGSFDVLNPIDIDTPAS